MLARQNIVVLEIKLRIARITSPPCILMGTLAAFRGDFK